MRRLQSASVFLRPALVLSALLATCAVARSGPIAYWTFDNTTSDAVGTNHGTLNGGATFSATTIAPVPFNLASLELDGIAGSYMSVVPQNGSVNGSYTVSAWANIRGNANPNNILSTRLAGEMSFDVKFQATPSPRIHGDVGGHNATGGAVWGNTAADYNFNYNLNQWYHVAYVVTPTGWKIFVDGTLRASGFYTPNTLVLTPLLWDNNHNISIGRYSATAEHTNGFIDNLSVFNYALTPAQVAALAGGTSPLAIASPDRHGAVRYLPITGDADSGISSSKTYTHALDFGVGALGAANVNGVAFTQVSATGNFPGGNGSTNIPLSHAGNNNYNGLGAVGALFQDMLYNAPEGVITLTGLTPGQAYDTRLYMRRWVTTSLSRPNLIGFDTDGDGLAERVVRINEDNAVENPPGFASPDTAYALSYTFVADSPTLTIRANQLVGNATFHLYGLTNELTNRYPIDTLFSTGLDEGGAKLLGGRPDPHYLLISAPPGETATEAVAAMNHPVWAPNDASSSWIGVRDPGSAVSAEGEYRYLTTFDLTGFNRQTAEVVLTLFSDNRVTDVLLNGVSTGITLAAADGDNFRLGRGKTFVLASGFAKGINTLEFVTFNDPSGSNPAGFRADLSGTAELIPEPSAAWLAALGLAILALRRRRR